MREYHVTLTYKDITVGGFHNVTNYDKNISEDTFNEIYKMVCNNE